MSKLKSDNNQEEEMLRELRMLLVGKNGGRIRDSSFIEGSSNRDYSDNAIKKYLEDSHQILERKKREGISNKDGVFEQEKIVGASQILKNQTSMVKQYVRDKIQSNVFKADKPKGRQEQLQKLLQMKRELQIKRFNEKIQEEKKLSSMIESTRKFRKNENKSYIPLLHLQSFVQRENQDYDRINPLEKSVKSSNNNIKIKEKIGIQIEVEDEGKTKKKRAKDNGQSIIDLKRITQNYMISVDGAQEDENSYLQYKMKKEEDRVQKLMLDNPHFLKVFTAFLKQQKSFMDSEMSADLPEEDKANGKAEKQKKRFKYSNDFMPINLEQQILQTKVRNLSEAYKFKPFIFKIDEQYEVKVKANPIKATINKKIGDSNKFHIKQCQLKNFKIFYFEDQKATKDSDKKSIDIGYAPVEIIEQKKEEGGIGFQKKEKSVQVVKIAGKKKNFFFEREIYDGKKLGDEIDKTFLLKFHRISSVIGCNTNKNMEQFIQLGGDTLDFSNQYLRPQETYPLKSLRASFLTTLLRTFEQKKHVKKMIFQNSYLSFSEIDTILEQAQKCFNGISYLNFSKTKLGKSNLEKILNLVKKIGSQKLVELDLSHCGLDDKIFSSDISLSLSNASTKIKVLSLQGNQITAKSVQIIRNVIASKVCQIRELNISGCPIQQFGEVINIAKVSHKLQILKANQCRITINNMKQFQQQIRLIQEKTEFKVLQLEKNAFMGTVKWLNELYPSQQIVLDLSAKSNSSKNLQSKYLKVQVCSQESSSI